MSNPETNTILHCHSISKKFGQLTVLDQISFHLRKQEFLSILGPSGCGKSTLLRVIAGLESIDSGQVFLHGELASNSKKIQATENRNLGMVFQDISLFPHLSVANNIAFGLKGNASQKKLRVEEMLALIDLEGYEEKKPYEISGGEQQRVALARAFAPNPGLILLDEPFSSLDSKLRIQLRKDLYKILRTTKVSVILVTHDQMEAFIFGDRLLVMQKGKIVQEGTPVEIYHHPASPWVASFVGESNFLSVKDLDDMIEKDGGLIRDLLEMELTELDRILVRPEDFIMDPVPNGEKENGVIESIEFCGDQTELAVKLRSGTLVQTSVSSRAAWHIDQKVQLKIKHFRLFSALDRPVTGKK
ncbi:MAG: ABC transporter ATP-binding protein [SAR324 cluster bacterium]|nr:ABC transporter ATP-binding protein [SAR324 cluster bacterium]